MLAKLEKSFSFWFLIGISFLFFLLRLPSLFEPEWYGDEGVYQVLGMGINAGRLLYRDIFDNKPPLLYLLYSFVNSNLFGIRLLSLIFGLVAVWAFYVLAKRVLSSLKPVYLATAVFAVLFGLPLIEGNIANAENFMLLPNIIAAILILVSIKEKSAKRRLPLIALSGLILGISFLLKVVAVFDFAAFFVFLIFLDLPEKIKDTLKKHYIQNELIKLGTYTLFFAVPILLTTIFFTVKGALSYFLRAVLFNNVGYVGYGNTFIIPQGLLLLKLSLLLSFLLFFFWKRKTFDKNFIFVSVWLAFSMFNAFFSQRPYTHYVLNLLPSFCLIIGLFALNKRFSKLAGIFTFATFIIVVLNFTFYTKILSYYQNFFSFLTTNKTVTAYQSFFDRSTPLNYEIADYIISHGNSDKSTFLWGNNPQVYFLLHELPPGRYTVAYHITGYKDGLSNTLDGLKREKPQFIVTMPNAPSYPFSLNSYYLKMNIGGVSIYAKSFK